MSLLSSTLIGLQNLDSATNTNQVLTEKPWKNSNWTPLKPTKHWAPKPSKPHQFVTTKGNKISLITGASKPWAGQRDILTATPPPEVSVSSHVIALRVRPRAKALRHVETVQGVGVETDGSGVNLSDLIMRDPLPSSRRRYRYVQHSPTWTSY